MAKWKKSVARVLGAKLGAPSASDMKKGKKTVRRKKASGKKPRPYGVQMEKWGRRVRRDIILLEHYLKQLNERTGANLAFELYDDPGDPPPPPNSF